MAEKPFEGTRRIANFPFLFKPNTQERKLILPYLFSRWHCKGNLSAVLHRALIIAHEHESTLESQERGDPFTDDVIT
jgi:hypothetical protein